MDGVSDEIVGEQVRSKLLEVVRWKKELAALRAMAAQVGKFHDDCGHDQHDDNRQCDGICDAWKAWRAEFGAGPSEGVDK